MMNEGVRAACVIGWPVEHSRSPLIHGYWLQHHGIAGAYRREAVPPEDLPAFIADLAARGYVGANVTLPHKQAALDLSKPDDCARAVGAANTLWLEGERLRSTNTDAEGFITSLDAATPGWDKGLHTAVVIGAGGAARAVVYGLVERGVECIHVVNRTLARAKGFRERFGPGIRATRWAQLPRVLAGAGLVVNASSLGMTGSPDLVLDLAACATMPSWPTSFMCRSGRHLSWPASGGDCAYRTASACSCIRPSAASSCGSAFGRE